MTDNQLATDVETDSPGRAARVGLWLGPTLAIGALIVTSSLRLLREALHGLMEGVPPHLSLEEIGRAMAAVPGVASVHDLHVWTISVGKISMTGHIQSVKPLKTLAQVTDLLRRKYNLFHTTIQVEGVEDKEKNPHSFKCENDIHA